MKISVIGVGYVGNAVKVGFETKGFQVYTYDKYKESDSFKMVMKSGFIFLCLPTPPNKDGSIDLSIMDEVIGNIAEHMPTGLVIIKSTVIPGTTKKYKEKYPFLKLYSNPEFLTAKTADEDFLNPDKIIVGYTEYKEEETKSIIKLYNSFGKPVQIMKSEEAEMVKYMVNTYYATRVIFANEIYDFCQKEGIDYNNVREGFELDKRVAPGHFDVMYGGYRGFGGSCLLKDIDALTSVSDSKLLKYVRDKNKELRKGEEK